MNQIKNGFFKNFFKKSKEYEKNEKIEIILKDLSKYLDEFKSDIRLGTIEKMVKGLLSKNVKIPAEENYNRMLEVVKKLTNNKNLREKNEKIREDLLKIENFLSEFLQNSSKIADSVDVKKGTEQISIKNDHIFKIYKKFGELNSLIFETPFRKVDPFSSLTMNSKNSLEIWGSLKSVSSALKRLNSQRGWIFKNKFVIKCHKDLKKLYDDIKQNISVTTFTTLDRSPINQSKIIYPKLQNCKKYISSAIISRIITKKIHPDDYDNIKSSLFDLYNSFSNVSEALFSSKFDEIDFKNFHLYHNKSDNSSAKYYIAILGKDLAKLYKQTSWRKSNFVTKLYKKLYKDYKIAKKQISRRKANIIKCMKDFSNKIIKNNVISDIYILKNEISRNDKKSPMKIIDNLYYDYVSIIKRFSIAQINYIRRSMHALIDNRSNENSYVNQGIDYLEARKENLLNAFSNLNSHMCEFKELKSYLYETFGKKLKSMFQRACSAIKETFSKKRDIDIVRKKLTQQEKKLKSNFSNLYKSLNKSKKFCGIISDKEKQKNFVNKVYYNYSEFEFVKKIVSNNISYINDFCSYWNSFSVSDFESKYFEDKKISDVSKTFKRISDLMVLLIYDYKDLQKCISDIDNSINTDVLMAGDNHEDSKEIKALKANLEKLIKQESLQKSSDSSKGKKSRASKKLSKKIESATLELKNKQEMQLKEEIQKAIDRFNNIPVNGTKIIGKIIMIKQIMDLGSNSSLNIVISTDKIDFFKIDFSKLPFKINTQEKSYDCGSGYSIELAKFDLSIGSLVHGSIYVYMSFKNANAGTMIVDMLSRISKKTSGMTRKILKKIGNSLSKLDNMDYLYKIIIKNKINNGKLDLFPCNIVNEDPIKVDDSQINIGTALSIYKNIKNILKPFQSSKLRQFFKGKTEFDKLLYNIKQLSKEVKLASRDPEVCRSLIRKSISDLDTLLLSNESSKNYTDLSTVKIQLNELEKYLLGTTKKISRKKYKNCNVCGSCLCYVPFGDEISVLVTGESSSGVVKSQFVNFPDKIEKLSGMTVVDLDINTEQMDIKFLSFMANLLNYSLCSNFNMRLRAYILTSNPIIKLLKKYVISISSNSKKNIYLK